MNDLNKCAGHIQRDIYLSPNTINHHILTYRMGHRIVFGYWSIWDEDGNDDNGNANDDDHYPIMMMGYCTERTLSTDDTLFCLFWLIIVVKHDRMITRSYYYLLCNEYPNIHIYLYMDESNPMTFQNENIQYHLQVIIINAASFKFIHKTLFVFPSLSLSLTCLFLLSCALRNRWKNRSLITEDQC